MRIKIPRIILVLVCSITATVLGLQTPQAHAKNEKREVAQSKTPNWHYWRNIDQIKTITFTGSDVVTIRAVGHPFTRNPSGTMVVDFIAMNEDTERALAQLDRTKQSKCEVAATTQLIDGRIILKIFDLRVESCTN